MKDKTTVFFTMQTSATASMWRIFTSCLRAGSSKLVNKHFLHEYFIGNNIQDVKCEVIPEEGYFVQFNNPPLFNTNINFNSYRYVINIRDPRDRICNAFHWKLIHKNYADEPQEEVDKRKAELLSIGIDEWVLKNAGTKYFDNLFEVYNSSQDKIVLSYAKLCLDFDGFVNEFCEYMNINITSSLLDELDIERVDNLSENEKWIGNSWSGSDIIPGRYKKELKKETIEVLNNKFRSVLIKMAEIDPQFEEQYLDGVI